LNSGIPSFQTFKRNRNQVVREIGDKITVFTEERKLLLIQFIRRFKVMGVREIGIALYVFSLGKKTEKMD